MRIYLLDPGDGYDVLTFKDHDVAENALMAHRAFGRRLARLYEASSGADVRKLHGGGYVSLGWRSFADGSWFAVAPDRAALDSIPVKVRDAGQAFVLGYDAARS